MTATITDSPELKIIKSKGFNHVFNKKNGDTATWGTTFEDDPDVCPFGPLLLDIEITTVCKRGCPQCYKANTSVGTNMSLETFKRIFEKLPQTTGQIAFGTGATARENPEFFDIMRHCREHGVIPNLTVADITEETADQIASLAGACAVSNYGADTCYDIVKMLTDRGMTQCNIHQFCSLETFDACQQVLRDRLTDPRLEKLNAIVFLSLKKKGRGVTFNRLPDEKFAELANFALDQKISIGFDSCTCHKALAAFKDRKNFETIKQSCEPCESTCMSLYINTLGEAFPCSFIEGTPGWEHGIDVIGSKDFSEVWAHPRIVEWRQKLLENKRACPAYDI